MATRTSFHCDVCDDRVQENAEIRAGVHLCHRCAIEVVAVATRTVDSKTLSLSLADYVSTYSKIHNSWENSHQ